MSTTSATRRADNRKPGLLKQYGRMREAVAGVVYIGLLAAGVAIPIERIWIGVLPNLAIAAFALSRS